MTTLAAIIHDFGLITYSLQAWLAMDSATVQREILAMSPSRAVWWGRAIMIILSQCENDIAALHMEILTIPTWLTSEARGLPTYLAIVPLDVFGIVLRYLRIRLVENLGNTVVTSTYLYGVLHSFGDRPAVVRKPPEHAIADYEEYEWYTLGKRARARGPTNLRRHGSAETALWYVNGKLATIKQRLLGAIPGEFDCTHGDGSALDREFTGFWKALRDIE